ncbi:SNF-related serine/threonine-protein kinase [Schistosoma japonicum]|nr:SNF-related serine/threonine-protein kinase [Schistosoma japonicum]
MCDKPFFYNPDIDTKIAGLYDLQHTIGRGHYAVVKQARHVFTGEKVAVKVIDKTKLDNISRDHLFQEVVCMKLVQHPNVVRLYEVIDTPTKLYLVLELGDGGDLYDYITSHGDGLSEKVAKRYFRQIVTAIAYCHKLRVVHRDLKPENVVFFEKLGLVKLTDFGFSNKFIPGTNLDTACGSLAYSAPEILLGDSYDAPKVDIWSLGVILYMLVSGNLPFQETNDSETLIKIMDCDYSMPLHLSPDCKRLISRLLIRDPQKRAHLDDILQDDWLKIDGDDLPIELFSVPLISREHLSFEDHMEILSKMAEGELASVEEIQSTLDRNEYNHIAATYYLLAERKLKRNYIEEYKRLAIQSQLNEKRKQEQQKCTNCVYGLSENPKQLQNIENNATAKSLVNNVMNPNAASSAPRILSSLGPSNVEDRVRRFSMILEDEEEEEEGKGSPIASSLFDRYITGIYESTKLVNDPDGFHPCLGDTSEEAMLEEEEEELATVAGLACVRSELLTDQLANNPLGISESEYTSNVPGSVVPTRPCSRTSGSGAEASDGAESEVFPSPWNPNGVGFVNSSNKVTSATRSLPPVETRRKHFYRRGFISHRPLTTVKSSPQLLKYIAEEDWDSSTSFASNNPAHLDKRRRKLEECYAQNPSIYATADDGVSARSLRSSYNLYRSIRYVDDQLIGLRPANFSTSVAQQTLSGAHSPAWTRRFFNTPASSSRPASIGSWNAVLNMSLINEQRRPSFCSSPVDQQMSSVNKRKVLYLNHSQNPYVLNKSLSADRRCSGPPGLLLAVSGLYHPGSAVMLPSRSDSDTSFLDQRETSHLPPTLERSFSPEETDEYYIQSGTKLSDTFKEMNDAVRNNHCSLLPGVNKRGSGRSPHRALSNSRKTASWCSSAPVLCETSEQSHLAYMPSNSPGLITMSPESNCQLGGSNTVREHCTPIREEDDEAGRSGESPISKTSDQLIDLNHRRKSESSSMNTSSPLFTASNITRGEFATLAESESTSTISQLPNISSIRNQSGDGLPNGVSSQCTTSNFSLSSLATSLRDSRYMIDIIRGTFELQCHYNRRLANSITGVSSCEYNSSRGSTSTSVRSLTAISENFPINNPLKGDFPLRDSHKLPLYNRNVLHPPPPSISKTIKNDVFQGSNIVKDSVHTSFIPDFRVTKLPQLTRMSLPTTISGISNTEVTCSVSPVLKSNENNLSSSLPLEHNSPVRFSNFSTHNNGNESFKSLNQSTVLFKHPSHLSAGRESHKTLNSSCLSDQSCSKIENMNQDIHTNKNSNNNNINNPESSNESSNQWTHKVNVPNHKHVSPFLFSKHKARLTCCSVS